MTIPSSIPPQTLEDLNVPLYERVRIAMQHMLAQEAWDTDQPIPSEQVLAKKYDVSIGTIRKAVERLVADGLLVKKQGSGTFLKRPDFNHSMLRFFRLRDPQGNPILPVGVVKLVTQVAPDATINEKLGQAANTPLIHLQRIRLAGNTVILSERIWLPAPLFAPIAELPLASFGNLLYPFYEKTCHQRVFSVEETLLVTCTYTDDDLGVRPPQATVCIMRIAYNLSGQPIEYRESYGLPEHFRYQIKIH